MDFSQIKNIFSKNKKIILIFIAAFLIFSPEFTFAEYNFEELKTTTIAITNGILSALALMLGLLTYLISLFLDPGWLNGSFFGLNTVFKTIWIMVSNIVYFIFAFLLIWIAFMNILGRTDKWELKQALPRFIIGVLIVPFSRFFIQFLLAISAILTVSVLTLPSESFSEYKSGLEEVVVFKTCEANLNGGGVDSDGNKLENNGFFYCDPAEENMTTLGTLLEIGDSSSSIFGIIYTYTYGVMNLSDLSKLSGTAIFEHVQTLADLVIKVVMDLLFVLVYAILIIALGLVLMVRGIYLWLFMMFSPVFGLLYFFDKKDGAGDGFISKFTVGEFVSLALVPVYAMGALSFGLLFIYVVGHGMSSQALMNEEDNDGIFEAGSIKITEDSISLGEADENGEGVFTLKVNGSISTSATEGGVGIGKILVDIGDGALGIVGSMILQIFGIIILWGAMMAAMRSSKITQNVIQPIHQFGNSVGELMMKAPTYAPVFGGKSATELGTAAGTLQSSIHSHYTGKGAELAQKFNPYDENVASKLDVLNRTVERGSLTDKDKVADFLRQDVGKEISSFQKVLKDPSSYRALMSNLEKVFGKTAIDQVKKEGGTDANKIAIALQKMKLGNDADIAAGAKAFHNENFRRMEADKIIAYFERGGSVSSMSATIPSKTAEVTKDAFNVQVANSVINYDTKGKVTDESINGLVKNLKKEASESKQTDFEPNLIKELMDKKKLEESVAKDIAKEVSVKLKNEFLK